MYSAIARNARTPKQTHVHFLSLLSIDLPLCLPKNVSLEAVMPWIPSELLFWKSTIIIVKSAVRNKTTRQITESTSYKVNIVSDIFTNKYAPINKPLK